MELLTSLISKELYYRGTGQTSTCWQPHLYLKIDMNFQADVTVTMSVVTTAASPVIPTQQTIHPMTPIVELRLLRILTLLNTKMQTLLFLTLQMLRKYLHLIVVGAVVTILVRDVMQKPPQFVRQTNSEP
jgi:hypothetical protein